MGAWKGVGLRGDFCKGWFNLLGFDFAKDS
ncbi:MAG: hypothetical protein JWN73_4020 [Betaproteobacteria bacterium]|nr:hypothetical protein [Betaproteobacteria bacterium]